MNKDDRRVRKTKKVLRDGLAELMLEKELRNITVRELVDKVDIHRATFYVHYQDIYDLYEQIENSVVKEIITQMDDVSLSDEQFYHKLVEYIYDNKMICRILLTQKGTRSFRQRIEAEMEIRYVRDFGTEYYKDRDINEFRSLVQYHISGCLTIIQKWVESNFDGTKEEISRMVGLVDSNFEKLIH